MTTRAAASRQEKLKGLIDLIADIGFKDDRAKARDMLGRVYEYFLGKFAQAEGKLGGEFFTPRCIVAAVGRDARTLRGARLRPLLRFGRHVRAVRTLRGSPRWAEDRHLDLRPGIQPHHLAARTHESRDPRHRGQSRSAAGRQLPARSAPRPQADYILANPPFNISDWSGSLLADDVRWRYGTPPVRNANYAWIQHFIHHLAPPNGRGGGVAGFIMANGSLSTGSGGEGEIRQRIIEADLVDCIVALPAQLFLTTGIPACLWFLTRDKTGKNLKHGGRDRTGETLFIDARKLGTMQTRTLRVLTGGDDGESMLVDGSDPKPDSDLGRIVYAFRQWRGEPTPAWWDETAHGDWAYRDMPGFYKAETIEGVGKHGFVLTPGRYVGGRGAGGRRRAIHGEVPAAPGGGGGVLCGG